MDKKSLVNINFEEEIEIIREPEVEPTKTWGKGLKVMPMFSVRDIEIHREKVANIQEFRE